MSEQKKQSGSSKSDSAIKRDDNSTNGSHKETLTNSQLQQMHAQKSQKTPHKSVHNTLERPRDFDVLFGRGKPFQQYQGNMRMQAIVEKNRNRYQNSRRRGKKTVAKEVIDEIRNHDPPVRFLKLVGGDESCKKKNASTGPWYEASKEETLDKIAHCLRGKTPKSVISMDQQNTLSMPWGHQIQDTNMVKQTSEVKLPPDQSTKPTTGSLMLKHLPNQLKNSPETICFHSQDNSNNHSDRQSSLTIGERQWELKPMSYFTNVELKPAAVSLWNMGETVEEGIMMQPRPVPRGGPGHGTPVDHSRQNPGVSGILSHSGAPYTSTLSRHSGSLTVGDLNEPRVARDTFLEAFNFDTKPGDTHSRLQPEKLSPESMARQSAWRPTQNEFPRYSRPSTHLDNETRGTNDLRNQSSQQEMCPSPKLDSSITTPLYHQAMGNNNSPQLDQETRLIENHKMVDTAASSQGSDCRPLSKETSQSIVVDLLKEFYSKKDNDVKRRRDP